MTFLGYYHSDRIEVWHDEWEHTPYLTTAITVLGRFPHQLDLFGKISLEWC